MAATTTTITFDFTKTNPLKRWQFNVNGAPSYLLSDNTIAGPTAQTVSDGSLFKVSRSDDQYHGLNEGNGVSIYLDTSINELLGISNTDKFVKRLIMVPYFRTVNNYYNMNSSALATWGEAGRWVNTSAPVSVMFKSKIKFIGRSDNYYMQAWPAGGNNISGTNWANFDSDINNLSYPYNTVEDYSSNINNPVLLGNSSDHSSIFRGDFNTYNYTTDTRIFNTGYISSSVNSSNVGVQYKYLDFSPGNGTAGNPSESNDFGIYWDYPLLTSDIVRFEIPFALTIPQFQHVWTDWPWNKSRKTLITDLIFTKIEFRLIYDTVSEYKTKFYAGLDPTVGNNYSSENVWLDFEKTRPIPQGYLATNGKYFVTSDSGFIISKRTCQSKITVSSATNGTVSSSYPTSASGYGDYSFNPDVSYITLDASPNYPIVFDSWQATDFDGNTSTISLNSTINVYNGLYQTIKPVFTASTPSPTPSPGPQYDYYYADVFSCGDCSLSTDTILVAFAAGSSVNLHKFYVSAAGPDGFAYRISSSTTGFGTAYLLTTAYGSYSNCSVACFI
jgi:hypothetical protein